MTSNRLTREMDKIRAKPFLKWAGGKQIIADKVVAAFPRRFNRYFEPFLGGGSIFFAAKVSDAVIADGNCWLIDAYIGVRDHVDELMERLQKMPNTKEDFAAFRSLEPDTLGLVERAALFVYLNKTCFRGLFRVNQKGRFNVPFGDYKRRFFDPENLMEVSRCLRNVDLRSGDFATTTGSAQKGDFVYLDPPYYKLGGYSDFNRYTPDKFREVDHERLAAYCSDLTQRGVLWLQSNSETPFIRGLYPDSYVSTVQNRREINLNSGNRNITELLISNFEPAESNIAIAASF